MKASPPLTGRSEGRVELGGGGSCWKHALPTLVSEQLRLCLDDPSAAVLFVIRDVASWVDSLTKHAYAIYPADGSTRKHGDLGWLFRPVEVRPDQRAGGQGLEKLSFPHAPGVWAAHAAACLDSVYALPPASALRVVLVRFEHLLYMPRRVVSALTKLGLRRSQRPCAALEASIGRSTLTRTQIIAREAALSSTPPQQLIQPLMGATALLGSLRRRLGFPAPIGVFVKYEDEETEEPDPAVGCAAPLCPRSWGGRSRS